MLIDVHAHVHVKEFDKDREATITRALQAGVLKMLNVGFDVEGNFAALALAKKYDFIWSSMGVHPHLASEWNDDIGEKILSTCKKEEKIVALGEMGLDYYKNFQLPDVQKHAFREQLKIAKKLDLPVIIHCRDAFEDTYQILEEEKIDRVLMHCFTGTMAQAEYAWDHGYYTAFTGIITYPSAGELREVAKACPQERLIIETDAPFLPPQPYRGKRNEPAFLRETFNKIVELRGGKPEGPDLEMVIQNNVKDLFGF